MHILVFGGAGQVGTELGEIDTPHKMTRIDVAEADLTEDGAAAAAIAARRPDYVINAAAFTNVDGAESKPDLARRLNADVVGEMAAAAQQAGAGFFHISTDYVFDGATKTLLNEEAATNPLNIYGETKRAGEIAALDAHEDAVVLRTAWVFSAFGANFVKTMLRLGAERESLSIVDDQIGGPTPAAAIAEAAMTVADAHFDGRNAPGLYHFQGAPAVSWAGFAAEIFSLAALDTDVTKIPTADYPTPARRPLHTVLDCAKIENAFGIKQPDWRAALKEIIARLNT